MNLTVLTGIMLSTSIILCGCSSATAPNPIYTQSWSAANDWAYQLQDISLTQLGNSAYDILVIDYSADGAEIGEWTTQQIAALRNSPGGPKLVLAYMSIGEAEDYRFYWQPDWGIGNPHFIVRENPDWEGNYLVRYWEPDWQAIIYGSEPAYLDRIISQGFDGVYLDKVDSYEDYPERPSARQEMIDFVIAISEYARSTTPHFAVFPQNAEELGQDNAYLNACCGIGREEVYYAATDTPTSSEDRLRWESDLAVWRDADRVVLTVDYCAQADHIDDAYDQAGANGFIEYCTTVALDMLRFNPGHCPD